MLATERKGVFLFSTTFYKRLTTEFGQNEQCCDMSKPELQHKRVL